MLLGFLVPESVCQFTQRKRAVNNGLDAIVFYGRDHVLLLGATADGDAFKGSVFRKQRSRGHVPLKARKTPDQRYVPADAYCVDGLGQSAGPADFYHHIDALVVGML